MIPVDKASIEAIFNSALGKSSSAERAAFLDGACGGDADLRARVDELLRAHDEAGSFLVSPTVDSPAEELGSKIGPYKILQQIGEGGFGTVYMAEQEVPVRRKVALKIIKLGMDTKQVVARFAAERQALAMMEHPNIAKVFDAGASESGRPYFVMELVKGIPITEYCDDNNLNTEKRLRLFLDVCHAIHHAHQKGVIHRDVKPSNVMVTLHDGRPVPKVIDFGVSKAMNQRLTEKTLFTEYHQFIGTPQYMSPEQAEMSGLDIDTRSDLYSLGALLYELLAGSPPFEAHTLREAGYGEIQRIIREVEPPKPSTRVVTLMEQSTDIAKHHGAEPHLLPKLIRGDLDWIVMKAIEKDRTRRYETAIELAADVRRHLNHEPVIAGPPSVTYKLRKFVQRHKVGVFASFVIAATLILGCALSTIGFVQARQAKTMADAQAARSQAIADFLQDMLVSTDPDQAIGLDVDVRNVVDTAREVFGEDHATVAATLSSLAVQLQSAGNYDDAEPLHRESIRIWKQHYGEDHVNVGIVLSRLGTLLRIKGDEQAAEEAFREALRITRSRPHGEHAAVADTLLGLAEVLQNRGSYAEAETALRESLRIRRAQAPHQSFQIAITLNNLANAMVLSGKMDELEPVLLDCLAAFDKALPGGSNSVAKVAISAGAYYLERGKLDEAEKYVRRAMEIYRDSDQPSMLYQEAALRYLATIVGRRDDGSQEYVSKRLEFIEYVRDCGGGDLQNFRAMLADYSAYLIDRDRPLQAITLALEALEEFENSPDDPRSRDTALASLKRATGIIAAKPHRPTTDYELALRGARRYRTEKPDEFAVLNTLGVIQYRLAEYEGAIETLNSSQEHSSQQQEGGAPADVAFIAMAHHQLGHTEKSLKALAGLRALMQSRDEPDDQETRAFLVEAEALIEPALPDAPSPKVETQR